MQIKDTYSHAEVSSLIKDIEANLDKFPYSEQLRHYLDMHYREPDDLPHIGMSIARIRSVFHRYLKEIDQDPLKYA